MTTLTRPLEISILAAPLAAIDRRALSQAWYSALGYAASACRAERSEYPACHPERSANALCHPERSELSERSRGTAKNNYIGPSTPRSLRSRFAQGDRAMIVSRRQPSRLAQRIEEKLLLKTGQRMRASVDVAVAGGRVHLTLQRGERRLHIVALCPKRLEATVGRALAQARFALARRGVSAETLVRGDA